MPSPIFIAAMIGVEKLLRIDLDLTQGPVSFVRQVLDRLPDQVPAFGSPIGFVINYFPDQAVRFDRNGQPIAILDEAVRPENSRVVTAAETAPDFRKRARGQELGKIHCDLARPHYGRGPPRGENIGAAYIEAACDQFLDVLDLNLLRLRSSHQITNGALGGFHRKRRAIQRRMREQPVDGAIKIAAIRLNDARDISDDRGRNFESRMHLFRGGNACFKNLDPQCLIEPSDFDAKTASQARSYSFVETFEIAWRPVGRDHDMPAGID